MENDFPTEYDFFKRKEIKKGTASLSTEERNKIILERCKKASLLMDKYNTGTRGHLRGWIEYHLKYLSCVEGIENKFVENQVLHLIFEVEQLERVVIYSKDPRGIKIAMKSIDDTITSIIEELETEK